MTRAQRMWSKRAIPSIAVIVALIVSSGIQALGLGEARVESFLNQPLDVRMRLLDVSEDDLDSLTVTPASAEDFERLGLMNDSLSLGLQIEVDRSVSPPVVRVSSERPVSDPVVQLLVDARWASGRMLREYTLFLDPPTVAVEAPAPAPARQAPQPVAERRADTAPETTAPASRPSESSRQQSRAVAASDRRRYGPVASGETLWSIASANLPAGAVTMNQMMIAIVELNPSAFRDGNINQLLRGAQLQLPDSERARAVDAAAAAAEVAAQNRAFRRRMTSDVPRVSSAGRDDGPTAEPASSGNMSGRPEDEGTADPVDHRLSLVPPGDEESGTGLSEDAAEAADLRQRLARVEEELYAARQEAQEFRSQVEDLETAIRDNPGGIGMRDAELAGLEATLRAARQATREDADPQLRAEVSERLEGYLEQYEAASQAEAGSAERASAGPDADAGVTGDAQDGAGSTGADATPSVGGEAAVENAPTPSPERSVTEVEDSRGFLANPVVLLVVGLAVLLALLAIVRYALRRRSESAEPRTPLKRAADLPRPERPREDPIEAARRRLAENPDDLSAHLGLLQTLATDGKQDEFGEALESMYGHVDSDSQAEWREALELAERVVPGHSLVKGSSDWVADTPDVDADKPVSDVEEESEVDDLMTRLDADLDESDDRDWLGDEVGDRSEDHDAPLLRGDDETEAGDAERSRGLDESAAESAETDDDFDFGAWDDDEDLSTEESTGREASETAPGEDETDNEKDSEDDDLVLDWPDEDEPTSQAGVSLPSAEDLSSGKADEGSAGDQEDDDIFAQSDDDIDVKLDLAKAYLSWNSTDSAVTLLEEVAREGNESQREDARKLLDELSDGTED